MNRAEGTVAEATKESGRARTGALGLSGAGVGAEWGRCRDNQSWREESPRGGGGGGMMA